MTITLPDDMKEELQRKAQAEGFDSVDQYVLFALRERADENAEDLNDMPIPGELEIKSKDDLKAKILEGLNSGPAIRMTTELWNNLLLRAEGQGTHQKPKS